MATILQSARELISETLLLTILSKFLECIPELACIVDDTGKIMCHNQDFMETILRSKTSLLREADNLTNIYSFFDRKSFETLRERIVSAVSEKAVYHNISLTHKKNAAASSISWSVKSMDNVGINNMVLIMGQSNGKPNVTQFLTQLCRRKSKNVPTLPPIQSPRAPPVQDDIYVLRRPSVNKDLESVVELLEYGEEQMRRRLVTATRRSSNTTLRNLISERNELKDIMGKKQTFVRSVAHEIRTPLSVVMSGLQILELEFPVGHANVSVRQAIESMKISSQDALDTIGDFIAYEKLSSNIMTADKATRNFHATVAKCIRPFYLQAQSTQIDLIYSNEYCLGPCPVEIDEYKMNQVIRNLVSNAIKFSPPYSEVRICVRKARDAEGREAVRLEVTDSGPGISEENQKKLFNEVVQFNPGELQGGGGSGLGLWIAKRIMDMHEGVIGIESKGEGFGCTFFVEMPLFTGSLSSSAATCESEADSTKVTSKKIGMLLSFALTASGKFDL